MKKKAKLLLNILFILAAVGTGVFLSLKPWEVYRRQQTEADGARAQAIEMERNRTELIRQQDRLEDPLHQEERARKAGLRKKGEVPIHPDQ